VQCGGTNRVAADLTVMWKTLYNSDFQLRGGLLQSSNTTVCCNPEAAGGFTQKRWDANGYDLLTVSRVSTSSPERVSACNVDFLFTGGQLNRAKYPGG